MYDHGKMDVLFRNSVVGWSVSRRPWHYPFMVTGLLFMLGITALSYQYAQEQIRRKTAANAYGNAIHPLTYMVATPGAIKALKQMNYVRGWYSALGEGIVTTTLWTLL